MNYQGLKSKSAGDAGPFETSSGLPILMLERITGAMLCGIGVATLWATSLLCGGVLVRGPSDVIELLAGLVI